MASKDDELVNAEVAGKEMGISARQVRNLIADGLLPAQKVGRDYIIRRGDLAKVPERKPGPKPQVESKGKSKSKNRKGI